MHLVELGQGVFAWTHPSPRFGDSNVGLIIDEDGLSIIDTTATPDRGAAIRQAIESLTAELELPIKRVVVSSSRVPFTGGSGAFWQSGFYGTDVTSEQLDAPANPDAFRRLLPHLEDAYPDDFATRPITHTIDERAWLTSAASAIPLAGESPSNLAVVVESAGVVFAGALASFGVTPLAFDGDPVAWIDSLAELLTIADTIVPGHGPVGGAADVDELIGYLLACADAGGDVGRIPAGPWDRWSDRRFDSVNVERAARLNAGDASIPAAMFRLLGLR
ncbi:MAG: MBL fold metallo-hydrolase [Acidimicrobiales bacterium]